MPNCGTSKGEHSAAQQNGSLASKLQRMGTEPRRAQELVHDLLVLATLHT